MTPHMPHELVAAIVDELQTDRNTLKSCSLVSSAFRSPSQRHLFRSLWLLPEDWKIWKCSRHPLREEPDCVNVPIVTFRGAFNLFFESPHLPVYVRELFISLPDSDREDQPLTHVLRSVENLQRLVIHGDGIDWKDSLGSQKKTLLEVFERPGLNSLHFFDLHRIPRSVVDRALESARVLSFHWANVSPTPDSDEGDRDEDQEDESHPGSGRTESTPSPLEELRLGSDRIDIESLFPRIFSPRVPPLTRLRKLHVYSGTESESLLANRLLLAFAGTLTHLEIHCRTLFRPLRLPALSALKSLHSLKLYITRNLDHRLPDGFAQTLADLPPTFSLHLEFSVILNESLGVTNVWLPLVGPLPGFPPHSHTRSEEGHIDARQKRVHCTLCFLNRPPYKGSDWDGFFSSFCVEIGLALPGLEIEFERVDYKGSYIAQLLLSLL